MGHPNDENNNFVLENGIHNDIVLAGMNAAEIRITFKLAGGSAIGIIGQQTNPTRYTFANMLG